MEIKKTKDYSHIKFSKNDLENPLTTFKNSYPEIKSDHIVADFSDKINTTIEDLLLFLDISTKHRKNGTSFVIVCNDIDIDEVPDEINIVPTFTEALDILEMDAIERDLGF